MKKVIAFNCLFLSIAITLNPGQKTMAQTGFGEPELIGNQTCPTSVFACDIDNDGDSDVISTAYWEGKVVWYENITGAGNFGPEKIITTLANGVNGVFACDLDGDGDLDVLSASWEDDKVAWYQNMDGHGNFGPQLTICSSANGAHAVFAADLDGDGDSDVLSASYYDHMIAWYENTDGHGTFSPKIIITTSVNQALSVFAADLDGDGDKDVLSASRGDDKVAWYQNTDGLGTFGSQQIISTAANGAFCVYACDADGDGDNDVFSASEYDNKIAWYENSDGNGTYGPQKIISTSAGGAEVVYAVDLDNDGDNDVLSGCYSDNKVAWYENTDGQGNFGGEQVISLLAEGVFSVYAADIDCDGYMDVLSASADGNKIEWYRNLQCTWVYRSGDTNVRMFPDPADSQITIQIKNYEMIRQLRIFDVQGRTCLKKSVIKETLVVDLSGFEDGIYTIELTTENKQYCYKFIKQGK